MYQGETSHFLQKDKSFQKPEIYIPEMLPVGEEQSDRFRESLILLINNQESLEKKSEPDLAEAFETLCQTVARSYEFNKYVSKFLIHSATKEDFFTHVPGNNNSATWVRNHNKQPKYDLDSYPEAQSMIRFATKLWARVNAIQEEHEIDEALDFSSGNVKVGDKLQVPASIESAEDLDKIIGLDKLDKAA